jgi:lysophospholipase L1-like esterase
MFNILFYGDSNTWGFDPRTTLRYPFHSRWTTVCAALLGDDYNCIPAGMNGRTTVFDDPMKGARNGLTGLDYELQSHKPLDLAVVMLGTNDLKYTDASGVSAGMEELVRSILTANERFCLSSPVFPENRARILLVSPVLLRGHVGDRADDIADSHRLADLYRALAGRYSLHFMDAAEFAVASEIDGVHLDPEDHEKLGRAMAERIREICDRG